MSVPDLVSPSAPAGEQNAPGRTPVWTIGVVGAGLGVGFFVVGFGLGAGLLVAVRRGVDFAAVGTRLGRGEADDRLGEGLLEVGAALEGLVEGSTISGRRSPVVVSAASGLSGPAMTPTTAVPPQHSATRPITARMMALSWRFLPLALTAGCGAVGCHHGRCGSGLATDPLWSSWG
ncbi:MAG: hypothetical protein ABW000_22825 [Actinoplanes sp.]